MNAVVVPPTKKKVVVVGDLDLEYRRARRFTEHQQQVYDRTVAMLEISKPSGAKLILMVPVMSFEAAFAAHIFNRFNVEPVECESLAACDCRRGVDETCQCLREYLAEPALGPVLIIVEKNSARRITEALMRRLRRPKRDFVDLEGLVRHPLFAF